MKLNNLGDFATSQQVLSKATPGITNAGGSSQQRLLSAHSSSQQNLNVLNSHRRDRSQRIQNRLNNQMDRDEAITGATEMNDTQVMSYRQGGGPGGDVLSTGLDGIHQSDFNTGESRKPQVVFTPQVKDGQDYEVVSSN